MSELSHLQALQANLTNEKARLSKALNPKEIEARTVWVSQLEKEIAQEIEFLKKKGIHIDDIDPSIQAMSDDELMAELLS